MSADIPRARIEEIIVGLDELFHTVGLQIYLTFVRSCSPKMPIEMVGDYAAFTEGRDRLAEFIATNEFAQGVFEAHLRDYVVNPK